MHFCPPVVYNLVPANSGRAFREYAVMGRDTVNFKCHHCSHCCRDVVCLPTPWDVLRIAMETGENPHEFLEFLTPEEIEGVNKNDPTWLRADGLSPAQAESVRALPPSGIVAGATVSDCLMGSAMSVGAPAR